MPPHEITQWLVIIQAHRYSSQNITHNNSTKAPIANFASSWIHISWFTRWISVCVTYNHYCFLGMTVLNALACTNLAYNHVITTHIQSSHIFWQVFHQNSTTSHVQFTVNQQFWIPIMLSKTMKSLSVVMYVTKRLLLPLALQPTVGFALSNNILPFLPIYHQLSPSSHS